MASSGHNRDCGLGGGDMSDDDAYETASEGCCGESEELQDTFTSTATVSFDADMGESTASADGCGEGVKEPAVTRQRIKSEEDTSGVGGASAEQATTTTTKPGVVAGSDLGIEAGGGGGVVGGGGGGSGEEEEVSYEDRSAGHWAKGAADWFEDRGPNYLRDRKKVPPAASAMELQKMDVFSFEVEGGASSTPA